MSEERDKSWIWNLALLGIILASLWYCVKWSWQMLQLLCGYDYKKGEFSIYTAIGAWIGVALFVGGIVWLASQGGEVWVKDLELSSSQTLLCSHTHTSVFLNLCQIWGRLPR